MQSNNALRVAGSCSVEILFEFHRKSKEESCQQLSPVSILPQSKPFLSEGPQRLFIGGGWLPSKKGQTFQTLDPGAGSVLSAVYDAGSEDVDFAVQTARQAFRTSGWAQMTPNARGVYLHRLADLVEKNKATLAEIESLDVGKPLPQAYLGY
jgi:hypothetical protein